MTHYRHKYPTQVATTQTGQLRGPHQSFGERGRPKTDEENRLALKDWYEKRWARGVVRDYSAPDLWGDNPHPKRRVLG